MGKRWDYYQIIEKWDYYEKICEMWDYSCEFFLKKIGLTNQWKYATCAKIIFSCEILFEKMFRRF